jgi:hypothetical protein
MNIVGVNMIGLGYWMYFRRLSKNGEESLTKSILFYYFKSFIKVKVGKPLSAQPCTIYFVNTKTI